MCSIVVIPFSKKITDEIIKNAIKKIYVYTNKIDNETTKYSLDILLTNSNTSDNPKDNILLLPTTYDFTKQGYCNKKETWDISVYG